MTYELKKQRGRKAGDGVLQNIDPQSSGLSKRHHLTYGRSYGDGFSWMIRWVRNLPGMRQHLEERRKALSERQIKDAESIQISVEGLNTRSKFKKIEGRTISVEALRYWYFKRESESVTIQIRNTLHQKVDEALVNQDADWFQKFADAIEAEKEAAKLNQELYPLHSAILSLAGVPIVKRTDVVVPERGSFNFEGMFAERKLKYNIPQLCGLLEKSGQRPVGQSDEVWQVRVRTVCKELGLLPLPAKTGRSVERD